MSVDQELLEIICCPDTHQDLRIVTDDQLTILNNYQKQGELINREGNAVEYSLSGGLIRDDGEVIYPIRESIPVLLSEEAIILNEELKLELSKDS